MKGVHGHMAWAVSKAGNSCGWGTPIPPNSLVRLANRSVNIVNIILADNIGERERKGTAQAGTILYLTAAGMN